MSRHRLHYLDLRPEPLERPERTPSLFQLALGSLAMLGALACAILFLFTL